MGVTGNRKARFYSITAAGRRQFAAETAEWDRMVSIMHLDANERLYEPLQSVSL